MLDDFRENAIYSCIKIRHNECVSSDWDLEGRLAVAAIKAEADRAAGNVLPIIAEIRKSGATNLRAIAEALNARGVATPRGRRWYATSVSNAMARS
jgi:hypothetical protein